MQSIDRQQNMGKRPDKLKNWPDRPRDWAIGGCFQSLEIIVQIIDTLTFGYFFTSTAEMPILMTINTQRHADLNSQIKWSPNMSIFPEL